MERNGAELQIGTGYINGCGNMTWNIESRKREVAYNGIDSRGRRSDVVRPRIAGEKARREGRERRVEQDSGPGPGSRLSVDLWGSFWRQVMEQMKHACVTRESVVCQFNWAVGARTCLAWSVLLLVPLWVEVWPATGTRSPTAGQV